MTLSRQLTTLILITFLLIFSGTFWISIDNTRSYLMMQLATQTQNGADSLGLSLAPHMQGRDIAAMDTMVNAAFDSGYYKSLTITSMAGDVLIKRENTAQIEGVPAWFIARLQLDAPMAESIITTGWIQSGRLQLAAHPGLAYKKLWDTTIETFQWSLAAFVLALLVTFMVLRKILKPLDEIEQQALAICHREFPIVQDIPKTREFARVVLAMNRMSGKIKDMMTTLADRAEQLRRQANGDELTGLINRRGFTAILDNAVKSRGQGGCGAVAILRLEDFAGFNRRFGHQAGDELLKAVASLLARICAPFHEATAARIGGVDFAVILPAAGADIAGEFGEQCVRALNDIASTYSSDSIACMGIVYYAPDEPVAEILADADAALSLAQKKGGNAFHSQSTKSVIAGNQAWKQLISETLQQQRISFLSQPVVSQGLDVLFSEALIRIRDEAGDAVSPGLFASMAERLDLHQPLDRFVIKYLTELTGADAASRQIGIKVSALSIRQDTFLDWLKQHFTAHEQAGSNICFEITEHGILQDLDKATRFIDLVHAFGGKIVVEHFGTRLSSFHSLRRLKLDYIKLDGSYVRGVADNADNSFFLQTVTDIAHGLDIRVIAEHVETDNDFQRLKSLGIDAIQGYHFGEPRPLTPEP